MKLSIRFIPNGKDGDMDCHKEVGTISHDNTEELNNLTRSIVDRLFDSLPEPKPGRFISVPVCKWNREFGNGSYEHTTNCGKICTHPAEKTMWVNNPALWKCFEDILLHNAPIPKGLLV